MTIVPHDGDPLTASAERPATPRPGADYEQRAMLALSILSHRMAGMALVYTDDWARLNHCQDACIDAYRALDGWTIDEIVAGGALR